jgi:hypothetical protein
MDKKIEETRQLLFLILAKLESIEAQVEMQTIELKTCIDKGNIGLNFGEVWLSSQKSMKTSVELLRDEIEELHQVMVALFCEIKNENENGTH